MFGFLSVVYLILVITCTETTILLCYFHLCNEDYRWWWRSFLTSGFTAVYFFVYSIHYYATKLEIDGAASTFLYFGYTFIMSFIFFIFTGKILCERVLFKVFYFQLCLLFFRNCRISGLFLVCSKNLQRH